MGQPSLYFMETMNSAERRLRTSKGEGTTCNQFVSQATQPRRLFDFLSLQIFVSLTFRLLLSNGFSFTLVSLKVAVKKRGGKASNQKGIL